MFVFIIIYALGLIGFALHLYRTPKVQCTKGRIVELFLLYQLVFSVGITSFLSFYALTFMQDVVAENTTWPSCPYEYELANVNLAYGFLGILSIWFRGLFWTAIVIGFSIWIFSDAVHHFLDAFLNGIYSDGNVGLLFYTDWVVPLLLCILIVMYHKTRTAQEVPLPKKKALVK